MLNKIAENNYTIKLVSQYKVKIQPTSTEKYLPIVEELKKRNTHFHAYQRKEDKGFKALLKSMHPSVDINDLKTEIETFNHKVIKISNIRNRITKTPLPLFYIEIEVKNNNKEIYNITRLLNTVVSFEPPRKKRDIPQCLNCQEFGHTKNYCFKIPVCVKCANNHLTKDCQIKEKIKEVVCANCSGNHPASYKGCTARKQLQQKLFPRLREKTLANQTANIPKSSNGPLINNIVNTNLTYAQAVKNQDENKFTAEPNQNNKQTITESSHNENVNNNKLQHMIEQLMSRMDTMLNLLTTLINKIAK